MQPLARRWSALSFDLDGTLVDTADEIAAAANRATAEFGLAALPVAEITRLVGAGGRELMRRMLARLQTQSSAPPALPAVDTAPPLDRLFARFRHHYAAIAGSGVRPYPGCAETLQRLRAGGVRLACVTNKDLLEAQLTLRATRLDACFEVLVGGDTLPQKKPQREVLDHVLRRLGTERRGFAHVGDSAIDIGAARNAGVAAWAVAWGYNGGEPISAAHPDRLFDTLPEIAEHVLAENAPACG